MQNNPDGTITLIPAEGQIVEAGTPIIAVNMNNMEDGIEAAHNSIDVHKTEDDASTAKKGHVQLTDSVTSTSVTTAATPKNVKAAYDLAAAAIPKSLATAANDFLVASGAGAWVKKTLTEVKTLLGLKSAAYTESSAYATAAQGAKADNAIPNTRKVNNKALSADISLTASDVGAAAANPSLIGVPSSRTLALSDAGAVLSCNNSSAITISIPLNSSVAFPIGTEIAIIRQTTSDVSISPASGVTLNSDGGKRKIKAQYNSAAIKKISTDTWILVGNLAV